MSTQENLVNTLMSMSRMLPLGDEPYIRIQGDTDHVVDVLASADHDRMADISRTREAVNDMLRHASDGFVLIVEALAMSMSVCLKRIVPVTVPPVPWLATSTQALAERHEETPLKVLAHAHEMGRTMSSTHPHDVGHDNDMRNLLAKHATDIIAQSIHGMGKDSGERNRTYIQLMGAVTREIFRANAMELLLLSLLAWNADSSEANDNQQ